MKTVDLVYECFGDEGASPLIVLHGFLASSRNWRTIARRLAENYRVFVLDMRNHGSSPHDEHMDYPAMAHDVVHFMDIMGLPKAHVLGHSMGGKIAMWLALHHPHRIEKLMVADIAPVSYQHSFDPMIQTLKKLPLDQLANRKEAEIFLADVIPDLGFRQFLLQNLLLKDGSYYWRIDLEIIQQNAHHIVGFPMTEGRAFSNKALFIAGERSAYVHPDTVYSLFPLAEIVEIPNTGHWLYVEAPEHFCQIVDEWLAI